MKKALLLALLLATACGDDDEDGNGTTGTTGTIANLLAGLDLGSITITPAFSAAVTNYTATVPDPVAAGTLTLVLGDGVAAAVTLGGTPVTAGGGGGYAITLVTGENVLLVTVTRGDTSRVYRVVITRAAPLGANAALSDVTFQVGSEDFVWWIEPESFSPDTLVYGIDISAPSFTLTPTAADPKATIRIAVGTVTNEIASGEASMTITQDEMGGAMDPRPAVPPPHVTIHLYVTAENGTTNRQYRFNVTRPM